MTLYPQLTDSPTNSATQLPRRSSRQHNPPPHLKDYISTNKINAHWCNLVNLDRLPDAQHTLASQDHTLVEPRSYKQAVQNPHWVKAMNSELQALQQNDTWQEANRVQMGL